MKTLHLIFLISALTFGCSHKDKKEEKKVVQAPSELPVLAEAYEYGLPLVMMDLMRENATNVSKPDKVQGRAPKNQFSHIAPVTSSNFKTFSRPDADAYYSMAWLDLSGGPVVLETPDTQGRYYLMPLMDAWGNVFASIGKRTTGTFPNRYLIVGPHWNGTLPSGTQAVRSPTEISWVIGRMLPDKRDEKKLTSKIQQGFKLYPLRISDQKYVAPQGAVDSMVQAAPAQNKLFTLTTEDYFNRLNRLMLTNPPDKNDAPLLSKVSKFGIAPGAAFNPKALSEADQAELARLPAYERNKFQTNEQMKSEEVNGWVLFKSPQEMKNDYYARAFSAYQGVALENHADMIGALAVNDDGGRPLNGDKQYMIHFNKDQLPQVNERWTLTVYDSQGQIVKNKINRFSLGSKNAMTFNGDGSLDVFISSASPGKIRESNWLPSPKGNFQVMARLYSPKREAMESQLPKIQEAGKTQTISLFSK
jgi:hypothetical protein